MVCESASDKVTSVTNDSMTNQLSITQCSTVINSLSCSRMLPTHSKHLRFVFQHLPEPNRACLVCVYAVTLDSLLSLYGIIDVT